LLLPGRSVELLAVLAHDRGGRFQANADGPPRSSMKVHSAAIRLTTSSGVNIDVIASPRDAAADGFNAQTLGRLGPDRGYV
jgi:hypothetical protein